MVSELLDLSSSIEIYVEHLQKVFFGGRIDCFRKSESFRISWHDLVSALRRHQSLIFYRDARVVAESLYLFGYFLIDVDKKSLMLAFPQKVCYSSNFLLHRLEKIEDDPMLSDRYLNRFQDVVDLERFRPFADWYRAGIVAFKDCEVF